jgi:hypothetical protein
MTDRPTPDHDRPIGSFAEVDDGVPVTIVRHGWDETGPYSVVRFEEGRDRELIAILAGDSARYHRSQIHDPGSYAAAVRELVAATGTVVVVVENYEERCIPLPLGLTRPLDRLATARFAVVRRQPYTPPEEVTP